MTSIELRRRLDSLRVAFQARELPGWEYRLLRKAATLAYQEEQPKRRSARRKVQTAVEGGQMIRSDRCESCSGPGRISAHHGDYTRPLAVRWLCSPCHVQADREQAGKVPEAVQR